MNPYLIPEEDRELNIKELFRYIRRHAGLLLIGGIVCACLLAGYKVTKGRTSDSTDIIEEEAEEQKKAYQAESELYNATLRGIHDAMGKQSEYLNNSVLMKIDPYNVPTASSTTIITTRAKDKTITTLVADALRVHLITGNYLQELADELNIGEVQYLRELIDVSTEPISDKMLSINEDSLNTDTTVTGASEGSDQDDNIINRYKLAIIAVGRDLEEANSILKRVQEEMAKYEKELQKTYKFTSETWDLRSYLDVNNRIVDRQTKFYSSVNTYSNTKKNTDTSIKNLEKPSIQGETVKPGGKNLVKYGGAGFLVGVVLLLLFYIVKFILNDKLISYADLCGRFRLRNIGLYDGSDNSAAMIDANIRNYKGGAVDIYLLGSAGTDLQNNVRDTLLKISSDYTVTSGGDILHDAEARSNFASADMIVLVEKRKISRYSAIEQELQIISNTGKNIAGIIVC